MQKNKLFFVLFFAAVFTVGLVYSGLPHFVRYKTLQDEGKRYVPITQESSNDIMIQAGRYREILDSSVFSGEVDTHEYKDGLSMWPLLSAVMIAPFILLTSSVFGGIVLTDFIFPVLIFISFFLVLLALTRHKLFSLFSAYVLMLFSQFPLLIPPSSFVELKILVLQFLPLPFGTSTMALSYLGREAFIPGSLFFIGTLYFVYEAVVRGMGKKYFIVTAGALYGLLFYLYLYFYVFVTIFLGVFFLFLLITKKREEALTVFVIGLMGVFIAIPFWIHHYNLSQLPHYRELAERVSIELGHGVKWFLWKTYLLFFALAGTAVWLGRRKMLEAGEERSNSLWHYFIAALALSGIIAYNINVLTGFFVQSDHWSGRVFLITEGIIWATLFYYFFLYLKDKFNLPDLYTKVIVIVCSVSVFSLTSNILYSQVTESVERAPIYTVSKNLMDSYEWLIENTPTGSVIVTPSLETNIDLSVYSHNKIFLARALSTIAPEKELLDRLYVTYTLFAVSPEYLDEVLKSFKGVFYFFASRYNSREPDVSLRPEKYPFYVLPQEVRDEIVSEYDVFQLPDITPYRIDYLYVGPREKNIGINDELLRTLQKIYDFEDVQIYEWRPKR